MKPKHTSHDPRVRHAGKAGAHNTRPDDVRKGRRRRPRNQKPKHRRWEDQS